jgi:hypothetical protein
LAEDYVLNSATPARRVVLAKYGHFVRLRNGSGKKDRLGCRAAHGAAGKVCVSAVAADRFLSALLEGWPEALSVRCKHLGEPLGFCWNEVVAVCLGQPLIE